MEYITVWPFWLGGLGIAGVSILLVVLTGKFLSITRGYASMCSIISNRKFFKRPDLGGPYGFRTLFSVGVITGGFLAAISADAYQPNFSLESFDQIWGDSLWIKGFVLIIGGLLWGYGARMARGCTSGNSIAGLSKGSLASLASTVCFLMGGAVITWLLAIVTGVY